MDKCYCYEKFKDKLPEGVKTTCFKEKCNNYRRNKEKEAANHTKKTVVNP